ncbi:MAG TPA: hypothetical protein PKL12_07680 [Bacteroidales bacterium]|jgi:DNA polymerase III alpha subunit|nr:hypothetical protein [Bacteroidales bacterium]HOQ96897.1 hypothetical protein [Bacteroidales bacterium]HOZ10154.1 hypothetical protein [Bacteroidales bacterium]HPH80878.1 hypothetical protein [Bacteroidales bacterium]HPU83433.1 hypothetical protein [Bacteroidales bacterium]
METKYFNQTLRKLVYAGAARRYKDLTPAIVSRIETEVYTLCEQGRAKTFVLWANLADEIWDSGMIMGLGYGAAPGSMVNYCLNITHVDPLPYNLLFERFFDPTPGKTLEVILDVENDYVETVTRLIAGMRQEEGSSIKLCESSSLACIPHRALINDLYCITSQPTDPKTWEMIQAGDTEECYLMGSNIAREQLAAIKPTDISELTALEAMLRPDNMELLPQYREAKQQNRVWKCGIGAVDKLLAETYGLILYQEQLMTIAALVGNYPPFGTLPFMRTLFRGPGDSALAACREEFMASARDNGYDEQKVQALWERMERFGPCTFNKSHAVCSALTSYYCAYVKAHEGD